MKKAYENRKCSKVGQQQPTKKYVKTRVQGPQKTSGNTYCSMACQQKLAIILRNTSCSTNTCEQTLEKQLAKWLLSQNMHKQVGNISDKCVHQNPQATNEN